MSKIFDKFAEELKKREKDNKLFPDPKSAEVSRSQQRSQRNQYLLK